MSLYFSQVYLFYNLCFAVKMARKSDRFSGFTPKIVFFSCISSQLETSIIDLLKFYLYPWITFLKVDQFSGVKALKDTAATLLEFFTAIKWPDWMFSPFLSRFLVGITMEISLTVLQKLKVVKIQLKMRENVSKSIILIEYLIALCKKYNVCVEK